MRRKTLSSEEAQSVAQKAMEIVRLTGDDFVKEQALISKIYEAMPEFKNRPIWKGLSLAVEKGLVGHAKYKGFYQQKTIELSVSKVSLYQLPKKDLITNLANKPMQEVILGYRR